VGKTESMDETPQVQVEKYLVQLRSLIQRGRKLRELLASDSSDAFAITANRVWQQDCGVTINELSGASKAHWLARAFSEAFLLRAEGGRAAEGAAPAEIVQRLIDVLEQAVTSLSQNADSAIVAASAEAPAPRRFDFVHNLELRPVLEQAYRESRRALEQGQYELALRTSCGILEAIVTDALEHKGLSALTASGAPAGKVADWLLETRLTVAERAGLIRGGWARLPEVAWTYRHQSERGPGPVTERDARLAGQVLHVVMRDLNPGR
jgi:hypothetical protein